MRTSKLLWIIPLLLVFLGSCKPDIHKMKYDKTVNGLEYHFFKHDTSAKAGSPGDIYVMNCKFVTPDDSVILDKELRFKRIRSTYGGDFYDGFSMLHVGDSVAFRLSADSFYAQHRMAKNEAFEDSSDIIILIGVKNIQNEVDYRISKFEEEITNMNDYIARKNWNVTLDSQTGIRYEITKAVPEGRPIHLGDTVDMMDLLWFPIKEQVIDKQKDGDPWKFVVGDPYNRVAGLSRILTFMHEGESVRALIPFSEAYGEDGYAPYVEPYATICVEFRAENLRPKPEKTEESQ